MKYLQHRVTPIYSVRNNTTKGFAPNSTHYERISISILIFFFQNKYMRSLYDNAIAYLLYII
jgi:hypothetical protein